MSNKIALARIAEAKANNDTYLNLIDLRLTELPLELFECTNLKRLDLDGNRLKKLPPELGNLVNLQYLFASRNMLTTLPAEIGNLVNLQWVNLHSNPFTSLPNEIGNLVNLQIWYLSSSELNLFSKYAFTMLLNRLIIYTTGCSIRPISKNEIQIGYDTRSLEWWLENIEEVALKYKYTEEQITTTKNILLKFKEFFD